MEQIIAKSVEDVLDCLKRKVPFQLPETLTELNLPHESIGDKGAIRVSNALKQNNTLNILDLSGNNIGDEGAIHVSDVLKQNSTLEELYLGYNKIGDKGAIHVSNSLKHNNTLKILSLYWNDIGDDGANALGNMFIHNSTLTTLNISRNKIYKIPPSFGCGQLTYLDISYNKLKELPYSLGSLPLHNFYFTDNPLNYPFKSTSEMITFLKEGVLGVSKLTRMKVILIGDGGVGKTALLSSFTREEQSWIFREKFNSTPSTPAINTIQKNLGEQIDFQFWDFAGQIEYGITHQHFLSQTGAIYVIVISLCRSVYSQIEYWTSFLKSKIDICSGECGLIVVGSKSDLIEKEECELKENQLNQFIQSNFGENVGKSIIISA